MDNISRAVVLGSHACRIDIFRRFIIILPPHDGRQAVPPGLQIQAQDLLDLGRPGGFMFTLALFWKFRVNKLGQNTTLRNDLLSAL